VYTSAKCITEGTGTFTKEGIIKRRKLKKIKKLVFD